MCKNHDSFLDLEDPSEWTRDAERAANLAACDDVDQDAAAISGGTGLSQATGARYEERCTHCRGTGQFRSWAGRIVGPCFRCKGEGVKRFATSPETRAKMRQRGAAKRDAKRAEKAKQASDWRDAHAGVVEFLESRADNWDFARSLLDSLDKSGHLTERQLAAAERSLAKSQERQAERRASTPDTGIDLSDLPSGRYAVRLGDENWIRFQIDVVAKGKWAGWVFVKDGHPYGDSSRFGVQRPGESYQGKHQDHLRAIAADPALASGEYGRSTGTCGVCGRELTNPDSKAAGIGPVCAGKFN